MHISIWKFRSHQKTASVHCNQAVWKVSNEDPPFTLANNTLIQIPQTLILVHSIVNKILGARPKISNSYVYLLSLCHAEKYITCNESLQSVFMNPKE